MQTQLWLCPVKSALGDSYACRKNIHQYDLSREWTLKCSVEIYSSYYPTYIPYFTFRMTWFFSLDQGWQSCSLPCLQPGHIWSAGYIIHTPSLNLKPEMRASIAQTLCWPLLQTTLSTDFSCSAVTIKEPFIFCYFSSTAIEILISTTGFFPVNDQLSFGVKQTAIMHSK